MKFKIIILFICFSLFGRAQSLYFVQGHPFEEIDKRFESVLYKLQSDTLAKEFVISTSKESLLFIKIYYDYKKLFAYKDGWFYNNSKRLFIVDLDIPNKPIEVNFDTLNYNCYDSWLIFKQDYFFCLDIFNRNQKESSIFLGINIKSLKQSKLQADDFKNVVIIGSPGGAIKNVDNLNVYTTPNDGKLYIPKTPKIEDRPVFPIELPEDMWLKEKKLLSIIINNNDYFVLLIKWTETNENEVGSSWLAILNKNKNQWTQFQIKGNVPQVRNFGDWLAGEVVSSNLKVIKDNQGKIQDRITINRISPGFEKRRKENVKSGAPFDDRTYFLKLYYPGILYILNLSTNKYIEWETGQGDSEILLVQDEIVCYRINDEIYKAPIINGEKLGKPELLIKDERVPDIHWAFISEN